MVYSQEEKRKIILDNYKYPSKQVKLEELKKISEDWKISYSTFYSLDQGCGDVLHLLVINKKSELKKCFFSAQQSCLITVAFANIICSYLEEKNNQLTHDLLLNCRLMIEKKKYNLTDYPKLEVFSDIANFPNRLECINLVMRGINTFIN